MGPRNDSLATNSEKRLMANQTNKNYLPEKTFE